MGRVEHVLVPLWLNYTIVLHLGSIYIRDYG